MLRSGEEPPAADAACGECDALQIQEVDPEGRVTARFFCCEQHMYDHVLQCETLFDRVD